MAKDNTVYVGSKPPMNYVLAVITQFHNDAKKVQIKARGRAISRAVDVAEIVRNKFMSDLTVAKIDIGTEELEGDKGDKLNVSKMTIVLEKGESGEGKKEDKKKKKKKKKKK